MKREAWWVYQFHLSMNLNRSSPLNKHAALAYFLMDESLIIPGLCYVVIRFHILNTHCDNVQYQIRQVPTVISLDLRLKGGCRIK